MPEGADSDRRKCLECQGAGGRWYATRNEYEGQDYETDRFSKCRICGGTGAYCDPAVARLEGYFTVVAVIALTFTASDYLVTQQAGPLMKHYPYLINLLFTSCYVGPLAMLIVNSSTVSAIFKLLATTCVWASRLVRLTSPT